MQTDGPVATGVFINHFKRRNLNSHETGANKANSLMAGGARIANQMHIHNLQQISNPIDQQGTVPIEANFTSNLAENLKYKKHQNKMGLPESFNNQTKWHAAPAGHSLVSLLHNNYRSESRRQPKYYRNSLNTRQGQNAGTA